MIIQKRLKKSIEDAKKCFFLVKIDLYQILLKNKKLILKKLETKN